jgi:hypothetical protein
LADVKEQASMLRVQWLKEKEEIGKTQKVAERVEQLRAELEQAQRRGDLHRASEIRIRTPPRHGAGTQKMEHAGPGDESGKKPRLSCAKRSPRRTSPRWFPLGLEFLFRACKRASAPSW